MSPDETAVYRDIATRLLAIGALDYVNFDGAIIGTVPGANAIFAHLRPGAAANKTDFLPWTRLREVNYRVELVRAPGADNLDASWYYGVAAAARDALSAVSLAGITAPGLTRVADDVIAKDGGPSVKAPNTYVLDGTFTYPIPQGG